VPRTKKRTLSLELDVSDYISKQAQPSLLITKLIRTHMHNWQTALVQLRQAGWWLEELAEATSALKGRAGALRATDVHRHSWIGSYLYDHGLNPLFPADIDTDRWFALSRNLVNHEGEAFNMKALAGAVEVGDTVALEALQRTTGAFGVWSALSDSHRELAGVMAVQGPVTTEEAHKAWCGCTGLSMMSKEVERKVKDLAMARVVVKQDFGSAWAVHRDFRDFALECCPVITQPAGM